jgi:hypothetical protein
MRRCARTPLALCFALFSLACGDDSDAKPVSDAGVKDAAVSDASIPRMIPRRDAQVATEDPIPQCDRADKNSCGANEVCDLVYRIAPGAQQIEAYTGCVPAERERALGDPCSADPTTGVPISLPGLLDTVFRDPCGPGLVCAPNRAVRGAGSCQPVCASGALDDVSAAVPCKGTNEVCLRATQVSEYCRKADACDPTKQTGCKPGEGCYMRWTDDVRGLVAFCSPKPDKPAPEGTAGLGMCGPLSVCRAGSVCLGPVRKPITTWFDDVNANFTCRPVCTSSGDIFESDAGADADGGVGTGKCPSNTKCEPFSESGLSLKAIPAPPYGQCEP